MSFFTALSGLNAAQQNISVTSNNIANVATFGFHGSRAEFSDIYFSNAQLAPSRQIGAGVDIRRMASDFGQGTTIATGNSFDLAIRGSGFFMVQTGPDDNSDIGYTRAGAFGVDGDGLVTNASGHRLTVFPTSPNGQVLSTSSTQQLQIPQTHGMPAATSAIDLSVQVSLNDNGGRGTQATFPAAAFDPADETTYAFSTRVPMLDDQGYAVPAQAFFVMEDAPTLANPDISYSVQIVRDGQLLAPPAAANELTFDAIGLQIGGTTPMTFTDSVGETLELDLSGSRTAQAPFEVLAVSQDGSAPRELSSINVAEDGVVFANYGAEHSIALGQVALATFPNLQGLIRAGDATYLASADAGQIRMGAPLDSGFGGLQSGAVEQSNVDITEELVQLIMAQRNYQASAKALETNGSITETVLNIRN